MRAKILLASILCIPIILSSMESGWGQKSDLSLEERIEQAKDELYELHSLLEEQKREYIRQHPIQIKPSMEPGVMWELAGEVEEHKERYGYLEKYVEYFPNGPKVQDAMWYMMSMAEFQQVDKDPFVLLDEYAKAFPTDEANIEFARACLYYDKVDLRDPGFWQLTTTQEEVQDNRENVFKGIGLFQKAIALAKPKDNFRAFESPTMVSIHGYSGFTNCGNIQESARWNIALGYEKLKMWEEAIGAYSIYLLEYPESHLADRIKAKIYLFREKIREE